MLVRPTIAAVVVLLGTMLFFTTAASARPPPWAPVPTPDPVGVWPLTPAPDVLTGFDPPDQPWGPGHRGVDLAGAVGQVVRSALAGTVSYAGRLVGRGVVVVVHGDTRTTYEPVLASVEVGTRVPAGKPVGTLEPTGGHCLPRACLHWGWLRGETYLDPLDLVGGGPVRLLPLRPAAPVVSPVGLWTWLPPLPYAAWQSVLGLLYLGRT